MRVGATLVIVFVAACDPIWGIRVGVRDPANQPLPAVTVWLACQLDDGVTGTAATTDSRGMTQIGGAGLSIPRGCDLFLVKPGQRTRRIRYRELCPTDPDRCDRTLDLDFVMQPE
jgi:hypothetical protein